MRPNATIDLLSSPDARPARSMTTVLVAEDDAMFRRILEVRLQDWKYEVISVLNGAEAFEAMQADNPPEMLLLDWMMPVINGVDLCRRIRTLNNAIYPYIVLLTGRDAKHDLVVGFDAGADDYLTKPFHADELRARLRAGARIVALQRELIGTREQMRFYAMHDIVSGVWNRRAMVEFLTREVARAHRHREPLGVMMIDLDHFKAVNDTFGHATGDAVLQQVAARLVESVRAYDVVGRYGGEEFLIIMSNTSTDDLKSRAEKICEAVSETTVRSGDSDIRVTVSIGATVSRSGAGLPEERLLHFADTALYRAKQKGRNRVEMCDSL